MQGDAFAYCLNIPTGQTKPIKWTSIPVTYYVSDNMKDTAILGAIDKAFQTWEAVPCSTLAFKNGGSFAMSSVAFDKPDPYIYIFWYDAANKAAWPAPNPAWASYVFTMFGMIQNFNGASIAINAFNVKWNATGGASDTFDVQNELTRLIGQVIGLEDSTVPGATMYPGLNYGDTSKQTLAQDDIDGLVYLYKKAGCPDPPPPGPSGCSGGSPATDGGTQPGQEGGVSPGQEGGVVPPGKEGGVVPPGKEAGQPGSDGIPSYYDFGGYGCVPPCASDEVCTIDKVCVKVGGDEDDGCGCRLLGKHAGLPLPALMVALVIGFVLTIRRKRN
jgi:hypothetical protein